MCGDSFAATFDELGGSRDVTSVPLCLREKKNIKPGPETNCALSAQEWAQAEGRGSIVQERLFDPETNIRVGTWYLGKLLKRYRQTDNPIAYALADYNAGRTHLLRWMKGTAKTESAAFLSQMDFPGTHHYVGAITKRHAHYKSASQSGGTE